MHSYTFAVGSLLLTLGVACGGSGVASDNATEIDPGGDAGVSPPNPKGDISLQDAGRGKPSGCTRTVNLSDVQVDRPEPFDVVIVADHSDSLSWSREHLSNGLRDLLRNVRGSEARFYLLTPTQYGASSEDAKSRENGAFLVDWKDPVTNEGYPHAVAEYVQTCTNTLDGSSRSCPELWGGESGFSLHGEWQFQMPNAIAAITPAMTDAQLVEQQTRIVEAIKALGGGGADQEQPLCTLNRYLTQAPAVLPKNVVFLLLSDEDDASTPEQCLAAYDYTRKASSAPACTDNCTTYHYEMRQPILGNELRFSCVPVDDTGTERPDQAQNRSASQYSGSCPAGTECLAEHLDVALWACGEKHVVKDCQRSCTSEGSSQICFLNELSPPVDLCSSSFSYQGQRYSNFADYCKKTLSDGEWLECQRVEQKVGETLEQGVQSITQVVPGTTTSELISAFTSKASQAFGAQGYLVSAVILDPAFTCPVSSGQSYASNLRSLATTPAHVHSLCGDYSDALQGVERFARQLVNTDYPMTLKNTEQVNTVKVVERSGTKRELKPADWAYVGDGERLKIASGVLGPSDVKLEVDVEDTCVEIVR